MTSFLQAVEKVFTETHLPMIQAVFGAAGVDAAFQIMEVAKQLYKHVELERFSGEIVIYRKVDPAAAPPSGPSADFAGMANLPLSGLVMIEVANSGIPFLSKPVGTTLQVLSEAAVVYHYSNGNESFFAGMQTKPVLRLDPSARSQFSVPTFSNLREALQSYAHENVRESTCIVFQQSWSGPNRLFFKVRPEATIRRSLTQFLKNRIGAEHDVWPEQNVDESHPVDIRVQPRFTNNRLMLIEIKWLGYSIASDGHITTRYGNARAQEGADQLAQYLEDQRRFAPDDVIQGYYVIIDARRKHLKEDATTIDRADGFFYETQELSFNPAHHESRRDFDPPYRMFARPIVVDARQ